MSNTILIVDDSPTAVPELKGLLESQGYTVISALRAEEALDTLRTVDVTLVITEALLPGIDGFEFVRQMRRNDAWSQTPVIMLTVRSAPEDYALGFEVGADDYFLKPMEPPKILATTRGLIAKYEVARQSGAVHTRGAQMGAAPISTRSHPGRVITVFSLKGGVGTSTIAVNLAVAIKQLAPSARVGLIDLSLEEGADSLLLDVMPTSTIAEWAREDLRDATPYLLNQYFVQHRSGISLMAAPPSPEQAETVRPDVVRKTLELAPQVFDYIVMDTASTFGENSLIALEGAEDIVMPMTPDMMALKTTSNGLRILKAVNISGNKVRVLMNEIVPRAGLTKQQVEGSLGKEVMSIPHAGSDLIDAANQGMPLVTVMPDSTWSRALVEVATKLCDVEVPPTAPKQTGPGFLGALDRLRRVPGTG